LDRFVVVGRVLDCEIARGDEFLRQRTALRRLVLVAHRDRDVLDIDRYRVSHEPELQHGSKEYDGEELLVPGELRKLLPEKGDGPLEVHVVTGWIS
jgi:hypothetical protein